MGTVYAKEPSLPRDYGFPRRNPNANNSSNDYFEKPNTPVPSKTINLHDVRARVDKVHVDGLMRTKDDIVKAQVTELFKAKNFEDVILQAHKVCRKLESLGCFSNIGVFIDTSKGLDATPEGVEVTFTVRELRRLAGGISTMVGNNEGSLLVTAKAPNIFGRGESLQLEYSYGSKKSRNINISAIKPFVDNWLHKVLRASIYSTSNEFPWSGFKQTDSGFLIDLSLNPGGTGTLMHNFQYEAAYREINASKQSSFFVREQCGPNLKSALRHICSIDKRDAVIFPTSGSFVELTTEVAGLGGDIGFIKGQLLMQNNWSPHECLTFQFGAQTGFLKGISNDLQISIADHFFLGGPLNLRGFEMRGCGPRHDGNATGGKMYWATAFHIYTPLPFRPFRNSIGDLFKLHGFINAGNLTNTPFKFGNDYAETLENFTNNMRCSAGSGIVLKIGEVARIELNFIVPLMFTRYDVLQQFQFGIGVQYL